MGVSRAAARLLLKEGAHRPFQGALLTLGRQHVYVTAEELRRFADVESCPLRHARFELHPDASLARREFISDDSLFVALGFDSLTRLDYANYEGVEELLDLNQARTPASLAARFDAVLNFGTLEHVYHVPHAMAHLARMTKPGGRILHLAPASNHVDHGFYSFSPAFFTDFARQNRFELNALWLCRVRGTLERGAWDCYDCLHQDPVQQLAGRLDGRIYYVAAIMTRTPDSTSDEIPQQSEYLRLWSTGPHSTDSHAPSSASGEQPGSKAECLLRRLSRRPALQSAARRLISIWRGAINTYRNGTRGRPPLRRAFRL